jgi:hypothetical protein
MSTIVKATDPDFIIGYVTCEWANKHQRADDLATAAFITRACNSHAALLEACENLLRMVDDAMGRPNTSLLEEEIVRFHNGRIDSDTSSANSEANHCRKQEIEAARSAIAMAEKG